MPTDDSMAREGPQQRSLRPHVAMSARAVVELLRLNQPANLPEPIRVIEHRNPASLRTLITLLTRYQEQISNSPYGSASVLSLVTKHLLESGAQLEIAGPDLGAICLIDQIFDAMLSSGRFDQEAWGLVARARFPVTKFALQDFSFFFAPQNVGRRLLNIITLHLLGSAEQRKGEVRSIISLFIDRLNWEYKGHISQFNSVCIETQSYFAAHQRRLSRIEMRISEVAAADGKQDRSEPVVVGVLNKEVGGRELPDMIVDFIYDEWRNSLRLVLRQEGENSPNWKRMISLTQSMVKIYEACQTEEGRVQYQRFWPSMFKGVKSLLLSVAQDPEAFERALDPLELVCNALIRGAAPDLKKAPVLEAKSAMNKSFEVLPVDQLYMNQVEALTEGEWIRIKTPRGDYEACKLTVKANDMEPWVFVNNTGSKVARKNRYALAKGLRDGVVEIVGHGQWIDDLLRHAFDRLTILLEQQRAAAPLLSESTELQAPENPVTETAAELESETGVATESPTVDMDDTALPTMEVTHEVMSGSTLVMVGNQAESISADTETPDHAWEDYYQEESALTDAELEAASKAVAVLEVGALANYLKEGKQERCKLAVKMQAKDRYIFVDRVGVKVWEANQQQVIEAVARGLLTIIDSGVKFDRALERVVMNIQSGKKGREW